MKRKHLNLQILIVSLFCCINLFSQTYLPTLVKGRSWEITKPLGMGQFTTYTIRLACDTVINSLNYLNVLSTNSNNFLVREDIINHKLYKYNNLSGTDSLLIDYDIKVGSSHNSMIVDSINYATYFGELRKVIYFNNLVKWIEGIGNSFNGISDTLNGYTNVTSVYISDTTCFPLSTSEIGLNQLSVTKAGSVIYFANSYNTLVSLRIFNAMGQLLNKYTFKDNFTLDLHFYSVQVVLLEMSAANERKVIRLLTN